MKKAISIMILAIATQVAMARNEGSVLNIRLSNNAPFKILIDGYRIGGISNRVHLTDLSDGKHFIEVYQVGEHRGYERKNNAYKGFVNVSCNTESFATIDLECHKLQIDRTVALNSYDRNDRDDSNHGFYPNHTDRNFQKPWDNRHPAGPVPMKPNDFSELKRTINSGSFESTRLSVFGQALAYNYFTAAQVREVMNLFWFESSKLEVAKMAYPKTVDQNNYYILNNEFTFDNSVNELGQYLAMR